MNQYKAQEDAIYEHMKRYGINRGDIAALRRLFETSPPYSNPHVKILAKKLLSPGEYYRLEMDDYIMTMQVPDAPYMQSWIVPYTNTRQPDPKMAKKLEQSKGKLNVAHLGWYYGMSIFKRPGIMVCDVIYNTSTRKDSDVFTPETMRKRLIEFRKKQIPTQEEIEKTLRTGGYNSSIHNQLVLPAEEIVINGRIWVRDIMNIQYGRHYYYSTYLQPNGMLSIVFTMPEYDYNANSDSSAYPAAIQQALVQTKEMAASLRVAKINDDGAPDPFVIERVEPAPLPVREKLPASQQ
jgi:hypothetical protein